MDTQALPDEFKEFLKLLTEADVEYLLIGGYAVAYHANKQAGFRETQGFGRSGTPTQRMKREPSPEPTGTIWI